jgi:hypothetical protein
MSESQEKRQICQVCYNVIEEDEAATACIKCKAPFHRECFDEYGGCSTYGCENAPEYTKGDMEEKYAKAMWGQEHKKCPYCSEQIPIEALACPMCHEKFTDSLPLSRVQIYSKAPAMEDPREKEIKNTILVFFVVSIFACLAPFVMLFVTIWYYQNKDRILNASPLYRILMAGSLVISVVYIGLFFYAVLGNRL